MAYINGNKPIVTNGLVYALDFGNPKSYTTGSNRAFSLIYDPTTNIVTGSTSIPALVNSVLNFTGSQFIQRSGSLPILDPTGSFTISLTVRAATTGSLFAQNLTGRNLGSRITTASSDFGFNLTQGTYSRTIPNPISTNLQHITYRYNSGSIDTFVNGLPVTSSVANPSILTAVVTSSLFINSGSNSFSGSLANFYIYNRALTADEIWSNYQLSATRYGFATASNKPYSIDENLYQWIQSTGTTDTNTISAISTFISGLKSAGLWNKLQVIYPFVGTTTGSQTINLKEPGIYRLGLTGSFSASNAGLYPSSSTSFVDSIPGNTVHPLVNSASAHLSLLSYDLPTGNGFLGGNSLPALGGEIIARSGSKVYHAFTTVGTSSFTPVSSNISNVEVLIVAGGGGGGQDAGGGGGAGGLIYSSSFSIVGTSSVQVIIGNGGGNNANGQNSTFGSIVSTGGGAGGAGGQVGNNGGSGGGGGWSAVTKAGGLGILGQGNDGGSGSAIPRSGGGGGSGQTGSAAGANGGNGGSGSYFPQFISIGGSPAGWFAGGGGGTANTSGVGGIGGGGNGSSGTGTVGVSNTGGGGGGGGFSAGPGLAGGSGIVIVGYDVSNITAITGSGTGFYLTETSVTGSVNSQFTAGITGSGNIGLLTATRTQPGIFSLHKNSVSQSFASASLGALPTDIFFNTANLAGSGSLPLQVNLAYASIGAGLTTSEVSTYYNLVSQLQTNLKRQNTLLDNYSGAAAAYSLRRIGPSGYFGPAIRVRRDSDNTLRDIGFTSDGQLDTVGLLDFVGVTGSGFVNTWYDESTNNQDNTQNSTGSQSQIVNTGSLQNISGSNALLTFDGTNDYYNLPVSSSFNSRITMLFWINGNYSGSYLSLFERSTLVGAGLSTPIPNNGWVQVGYMWDGTANYFIINGVKYAANAGGNFPYDFPTYKPLFWMGRDGIFVTNAGPNLSFHLQSSSGGYTGFNWSNFNTWQYKTLGVSATGGNPRYYSGSMANIIFYNRVLSDSEILANYNSFIKPVDTDYQAFITATGITQPTQSAALETLVSDLKSYGLWSKMKAIYPMVTDKNNRFAYSQALATTWNATNVYVTQSFTTAPDGTTTGNFVSESAVTDTHFIYQTISDGLVTGSEYVASIYGKFLNRPWIAMETNTGAKAWFNIQTGITGSLTGSNATITAVSGGWYRCALYFTSSVASGPQNIQYNLADSNGNLSYAGVAGTGSYLWGAQFENGNVLGPYRATTTSTGFTTGSMLDQMKYNLVNPVDSDAAIRLTYSGSWNPGYGGNTGNGIDAVGYPKLTPRTAGFSSTSGHISYYQGNSPQLSSGSLFSSRQTAGTDNYFSIKTDLGTEATSGTGPGYGLGGGFASYSIPTPIGFVMANMYSTGATLHQRNQILQSTGIPALRNIDQLITINATSVNGAPSAYSSAQSRFITIGPGLSTYEAKALYWIVQKYQTTLGRQVY
jgi:hypothetical protein